MTQTTIAVAGMSCGHCVSAVEGSVSKLDGVQSVKVDLGAGKVELAFDGDVINLQAIIDEIEDQGYDVEQ